MRKHRAFKGVLHNFLGTYTSRNSDYDGYWIFGLLEKDLTELKIDLLNPVADIPRSEPVLFAIELARRSFREQVEQAGLSITCLHGAELCITKLPDVRHGFVNRWSRQGHEVRLTAKLITLRKTVFAQGVSMFVAPHSAIFERRSVRRL